MQTFKYSFLMNKIFSFLLLLLIGVITACSSDPVTPIDERKNKDHGDPAKVVLTLTQGKLSIANTFVPDADKSAQVITYALQEGKGWQPAEGSAEGWKVSTDKEGAAYQLTIRYYDYSGADITSQFVSNGQDRIHQHFFIPQNVRTTNGTPLPNEERSDRPYSYLYLDTTPWDGAMGDADVKLIGPDNPIGMKGVFQFHAPRNIMMNIRLMHAHESKFTKSGKPSPYYAPTPGQLLNESWDLQMTIPVNVQGEENAEDEPEVKRIELTMASGHFHGTLFHQDAEYPGVKHRKSVQKMILVPDGKGGWKPAEGSATKFYALSSNTYIAPYGLWIRYYDADGTEITNRFIEQGAVDLHQHFFTPIHVKPTFDGKAEADDNSAPLTLLNYVYMDTDPWNGRLKSSATIPAARLIGSKTTGKNAAGDYLFEPLQPFGHKGFFSFLKPRKQFDIQVRLMHSENGKYRLDNGRKVPSPFYSPSPAQLQTAHFELNYTIPVVVYAARDDMSDWESSSTQPDGTPTTFTKLKPQEQKFVHAAAVAFGVSDAEMLTDIFAYLDGTADPESGSLWF